MLGCVGMSDGVGGECHRQTPPWLQHQRHNHPKRGDLTKPQTNQCQALIADTWVDRHVQIVLSKFSDFPKGLAGRLVKGLFTYYSSQNQGFLDPLRQQWSAFGLPPLPPSSAFVSICPTPLLYYNFRRRLFCIIKWGIFIC